MTRERAAGLVGLLIATLVLIGPAPAASAQGVSSAVPRVDASPQAVSASPLHPPVAPLTNAPVTAPLIDATRFTFVDVVRALGQGHPLLDAARARARAAGYDVVAAGLWTNPQLNVTYARSVTPYTTYDPIVGFPQLGVTQLVETAGLPAARRRAAERELAATRAEVDGVWRGLVFDAQAAFVALAAQLARVGILRNTVARLEQADAIIRSRVAAGAAPRYDASRMALALADARAAVADAEADAEVSRGNLAVAVGPGAAHLRGAPMFDLAATPTLPSFAALRSAMLASRPDLVAARERARAARAHVEVARRAVFQGITVSLFATYGAGTVSVPGQTGTASQVDLVGAVSIPLPIIDRGQGTIPAAAARVDATLESLDAAVLEAEQRLAANYAEFTRRRDALAAYLQTGATNSENLLSEAAAGYREGRISVFELVDAYLSVRDAQLRANSLELDAHTAAISLLRVGGIAQQAAGAPR